MSFRPPHAATVITKNTTVRADISVGLVGDRVERWHGVMLAGDGRLRRHAPAQHFAEGGEHIIRPSAAGGGGGGPRVVPPPGAAGELSPWGRGSATQPPQRAAR